MPECALNLAQAAVYLALAPKSNASYEAIKRARGGCASTARRCRHPSSRTRTTRAPKKLGRGEGYDYPHDRPEGVSEQELMPPEAVGERFLELTEHGEERELRERLERIRRGEGSPLSGRPEVRPRLRRLPP